MTVASSAADYLLACSFKILKICCFKILLLLAPLAAWP
jgi:hypothetical protein